MRPLRLVVLRVLALVAAVVGLACARPHLSGNTAQAQILDPDRCVTCTDKLEHAAGGAGLDLGFRAVGVKHPAARIGLVAATGLVFEIGQFDAARGTEYRCRPGYCIGLLDLGADVLGAVAGELIGAGLTKLWRAVK